MGSQPPSQDDWLAEEKRLLIGTAKWGLLGAAAGVFTGAGTRFFLWTLSASGSAVDRLSPPWLKPYWLLPLALPAAAWVIRRFAPEARGHGTEQVITAVHRHHGKMAAAVAPVKLLATVVTLAFGGSVGKEGPAAQIGAAITNLFADAIRLSPNDRRRIVICGISAGFAAVFGTPVSGAVFGVEVLYLGEFEYSMLFPSIVAGIVAHLVCGSPVPLAAVHESFGALSQARLAGLAVLSGAAFGGVALALVGSLRAAGKLARRFESFPNLRACAGGLLLVGLYSLFGDPYSGLGLPVIDAALAGRAAGIFGLAFLVKIAATSVTLEAGGSGGIVTSIFFIGTAAGAAFASAFGLPPGVFAAFGMVAVLAAATNAPIAAVIMGLELLPAPVAVYAALCACTAYLLSGHGSVYPSQRLGLAKAAEFGRRRGATVGDW